jgi:hypothetical protein
MATGSINYPAQRDPGSWRGIGRQQHPMGEYAEDIGVSWYRVIVASHDGFEPLPG